MADPVHEGDTIQLFCSEAEGFVYVRLLLFIELIILLICVLRMLS